VANQVNRLSRGPFPTYQEAIAAITAAVRGMAGWYCQTSAVQNADGSWVGVAVCTTTGGSTGGGTLTAPPPAGSSPPKSTGPTPGRVLPPPIDPPPSGPLGGGNTK
jgi:hypothetical protein